MMCIVVRSCCRQRCRQRVLMRGAGRVVLENAIRGDLVLCVLPRGAGWLVWC